jgi:hypothetical protein
MSKLGTPLRPRSPAWFWVGGAAIGAAILAWRSIVRGTDWWPAAIFGLLTTLLLIAPRFRKREFETVQVDDSGVLRVDGSNREEIRWDEISEVRIVTTNEGPYREDVFFVLAGSGEKNCVVPHEAAVRTKLLEELYVRFPSLNDKMVIRAMGSTSNNNFVIWKRADNAA